MNMIPSMLIAATLIGSGQNPQINCDIDLSALQSQLKDNCMESQVMIGSASDAAALLKKLGIDISSLDGCFAPSAPETKPETKPETPEISVQSYAEQVVALVNEERAKVNLPALTMSAELNSAADIRAAETVQSFSHTRPDGSSFSSVLTENGISYRGAGENIAWGQKTPEEVVSAWMSSDGHRANILNKNFSTIGIGYHLNNSTPYWVQLFTY